MCGIIGIKYKGKVDESNLLSSISHRGPDSSGIFKENDVWLGHTRLSIQDLSPNGNQPMLSADKRYVIVFNGEIYNHQEIRKDLIEFTFHSTSDTETVLYAFIKFGTDCLKKMNGIFAFAIYDRKQETILVARDRFGVKPLYYYADKNLFAFSSELKSLLNFNISKEIDHRALVNYISLLWSPGEMTPFLNVKKLLPGHYITLGPNENTNEIKILPFDHTTLSGKYSNESEEKLIDTLDKKLTAAVERQLLSDVPVGFFLSGGLDSTLLVAIAKKLYPQKKFPCFTIETDSWGKKDKFSSDIHYAKMAAAFLDVDLHVVKAEVNIVKDFDKMVWHLDEPQADAAPLNVLNISALANSKGIKVLIGGAGGDDLFSGYRRHHALQYEGFFESMPLKVRKKIRQIIDWFPVLNQSTRRLKKLAQNIDKPVEYRLKGYFKWLEIEKVKSLFTSAIKSSLVGYDPTFYFDVLSSDLPDDIDNLSKMLYWELNTFLVDHNLNYTDKMAMAVGVEARVPYLDNDLVEFSNSIPPYFKMRGNEAKYLLKKVAERYLPPEIIYRPKTGFGAPVRKWITEDLRLMVEERLSPDKINKRGIFNAAEVSKLIRENAEGKIDASYSIWSILAIESWFTQFVD